jgi:hypothetical protein
LMMSILIDCRSISLIDLARICLNLPKSAVRPEPVEGCFDSAQRERILTNMLRLESLSTPNLAIQTLAGRINNGADYAAGRCCPVQFLRSSMQ